MTRKVRSVSSAAGPDRPSQARSASSADGRSSGGRESRTKQGRQAGRPVRAVGGSAQGPAFQRPSLADRREQRRRQSRERRLRESIITPSGVRRIRDIDADRPVRRPRRGLLASLRDPVICYYGFIICVALLLILGIVMVFSSSSVDLIAAGQSPYSKVIRQCLFAFAGVVLGVIAAHIDVDSYRHGSFGFFFLTLCLQGLTLTPLGASAGGNSGWIVVGPVSFQPAELLKLSLCLWMPSTIVASRNARHYGRSLKEQLKPFSLALIGLFSAFGLVMAGKDLGTDIIILVIGGTALLCGGIDTRLMAVGVALVAAAVVGVFVTGSGNRMDRIRALLSHCQGADDKLGVCYQVIHGRYALASGGFFGLGLGASREKWSYLPEAQNDFIFAVIGEELGFVGAFLVILLFVLIAWFLGRVAWQMRPPAVPPTTPAARDTDIRRQYSRLVLMCILGWICFQAFINILVVLQILPVMGVPLPFVSAGGTALIACLTASGAATAMMREQPEISAVFPGRTARRRRRATRAAGSIRPEKHERRDHTDGIAHDRQGGRVRHDGGIRG